MHPSVTPIEVCGVLVAVGAVGPVEVPVILISSTVTPVIDGSISIVGSGAVVEGVRPLTCNRWGLL